MQRTIRHKDLRNGMKVWVQGYLFEVRNIRSIPVNENMGIVPKEHAHKTVIRYEGHCTSKTDITGTPYDGGTYGAHENVPCTIEEE